MSRRALVVVLGLAVAGAGCDKLQFLDDGQKERTPFLDAERELTAKADVAVQVLPAAGGKSDTSAADVIVIFKTRPLLEPAEAERLANLVVRKHVPGVKTVTVQVAPQPGGRGPPGR